ncbi:two-component system nitrogen regulation sensor histidine kinase GlnL [Rhodobacter aestuarii]|uniref:histidine kinase n=1 Tax=Rhodobacter aestuarii TaxID=453582 RepID=A0A1N7JB67_9RHOB|nr:MULTISPECIES: ATP-binding protein [Rhodobacter]PTV96985.1 two-component system nitrogen regulation sensor histidine kinase GlnL [Rhodobacter aestuarii]SIS46507.1 two-component system, NtrC family, nitrogen regulation sensor histidine kinase GlnL [Rhodobacter aestuarii]SOB98236.1 two-component system nitrogen regulation sensor histidine kinase GlnL [Rhodobacter sp. JA431]
MTLPPPGIIWTSLPLPALMIDGADKVIEINPAAELFLNLSARALKGHVLGERLAIAAPLEEIFARVRKNRSALFVNDVDLTTGERAPVQCNLQVAPVGDDPETVLLLISPREIADRLGRASMVKSAARSAIGMAEMLAHEIKNPLAGIAGAAQLLSMNLSGDDLELTDLIVDETRRVVKLLEQVEQFGNVRPPEMKAVNIHDVLDRARKSAAVGFGVHMLIIEDYDPSLPPTMGDADQLTQVFLNLVKNAAEAAKEQGTIRLRTFYDYSLRLRGPDGNGQRLPLQIEVIDDGPGIPPDIANALFEPFVSGRENGTGLGLALVSKIISEHNGWINVDSVPGRTVFRVSLPVAPKEL